MRVIFSAGGTGGHLYPALALADYIKQQNKDNEVLFIGSKYRIEATKVAEHGYNFIGLDIITPSGSIFKKIKGYSQVFLKVNQCKQIIKEFKPDIVIGFGGYTSYSAIKAAIDLNIPTMLHEQNSVVGKSNKTLAKKVDCFITAYPDIQNQTHTNNVIELGNPTSYQVTMTPKTELASLGLQNNLKTILIVMGSQGSMTIDNAMQKYLKNIKNSNFQIIYVSGKDYYKNHENNKYNSNIKVLPYIDGLVSVIKACDIIVSRAGASALTEILSAHKPAILIPSKYVTNNHQYHNAKAIIDKKAALMIEETDNLETDLSNSIDLLLNDNKLYESIIKNTSDFNLENSAENIYKLMLKKKEDQKWKKRYTKI
ncbi:undecaprenyldiphospho-muramoylpentapeptide beta-N-acetylglucosaminyltransferase [Mycoplasma sp. P36-A1]|uniref:undecaprenyldiphospho-muramoylpentapeptide beta-N-acetylglucosaminyltransferase n=1 Tax=Mycoplasma sp. P36-A1 TaxID=3252900 RepID=UPI003C2E1DBD